MHIQRLFLVGLPVIVSLQALATPLVPGPTCSTASLATYIAMKGGCILGELGFTNFSFTGMGSNVVSASAVTVTPLFFAGDSESLPTAGLSFSSPGFSVTGNQSATYFLDYSVDPHPIIVNFDDTLNTSSPVAPGVASISTNLCIGGPFAPSSSSFARGASLPGCGQTAGSPPSFSAALNVFDDGVTKQLFDTTGDFDPANFADVQNMIQLSANGASADFNHFSNSLEYLPDTHDTHIPEPASYGLIGGGLLVLWLAGKRRASV